MTALDLLALEQVGERVLPRFLSAADEPWLRALLDVFQATSGRSERERRERLRSPLPGGPPAWKVRLAAGVLERGGAPAAAPPIAPRRARALLFGAASRLALAQLEQARVGPSPPGAPRPEALRERTGEGPCGSLHEPLREPPGGASRRPLHARALALAAAEAQVAPGVLEACLFADLPGERAARAAPSGLGPTELALQTNRCLTQSLLARASRVELTLLGNARPVVRLARLRGLICTVRRPGQAYPTPTGEADDALLTVSGPLSLFRRTRLYGRALASLVPALAWCDRFRLRAELELDGARRVLELRTGDPILPSAAPAPFDSKLEERFARDLAKLTTDWELVREPEPLEAGGALIFPDFLLRHRHDPSRRALVEVVGFWTPEYLRRKLTHLALARTPTQLIVCIDTELNCGPDDLPPGARVVRYRRRLRAADVLLAVDERAAASS